MVRSGITRYRYKSWKQTSIEREGHSHIVRPWVEHWSKSYLQLIIILYWMLLKGLWACNMTLLPFAQCKPKFAEVVFYSFYLSLYFVNVSWDVQEKENSGLGHGTWVNVNIFLFFFLPSSPVVASPSYVMWVNYTRGWVWYKGYTVLKTIPLGVHSSLWSEHK